MRSLLGAVFNAAALHDAECLGAEARLRYSLETRIPGTDDDVSALLDDWRRAVAALCTIVQPAAGSRVGALAPFTTALTATGAIASLDDQGLDAFLRPIFDEAGIADRFVLRPGAERDRGGGPAATVTSVDLIRIVLGGEALFDHLLRLGETISYGSAYRAMLGPTAGPWRSLLHVPMVLQVARGTDARAVGDMNIRLDALIVNNRTRRPGSGRMKDPEYAQTWTRHFGGWTACDHTVADINVDRSPTPHTADVPPTAADQARIAPTPQVRPEADQTVEDQARIAPTPSVQPEPDEDVVEPFSRRADPPPPEKLGGGADPAQGEDGDPEDDAAMERPSVARALAAAVPIIEELADVSERPRRAGSVRRALLFAATCGAALTVALLVIVGSSVASRVSQSRPSDPEAQSRSSDAAAPVPAQLALTERFEALAVGSDPGWETSGPGGGTGMVRIAPWPTSVNRSVRVKAGAADQAFAACRSMPAIRNGGLLAGARVFLDGSGTSDTTIASVRSGGDEVASLRIGPGGEILGVNNIGARDAAAAIAPNAWYDVSFDLDLATRTYRLAVSRSDPPTVVSDRGGRWTRPVDGGIDRICFAPPGGVAERSIYINEVRLKAR